MRFGYGLYCLLETAVKNPYFPEKSVMKGHEFHYSRVLEMNKKGTYMAFHVRRGRGIVDNKDGICYKNVFASYTHLHAIGSPEWTDGMVRCAGKYKIGLSSERM